MKAIIEVLGQTFSLSATNKGVTGFNGGTSYKYSINVKCSEGLCRYRSFMFHDSIANYQDGKDTLSEEDLIEAFYYFVSDALAGDQEVEDFIYEFGYEETEGAKIYRACVKQFKKYEDLTSLDLYEVIEELQTKYNL